jgi:ribosomal protein L31
MFSSSRSQSAHRYINQQIRHASLLKRPKRPYTFTQLITLSDGSTFLHRTTSPQPVYRTTKDTKNHALWNPSSQSLLNVEEDEAGRLKRFRKRFGRGFDADAAAQEVEEGQVLMMLETPGVVDLTNDVGYRKLKQPKTRTMRIY